jgi:hypothetical protein
MQATKSNSNNPISNESVLPWFEQNIDEIFFQSLYEWNAQFRKLMNGDITQEEFRKYTLQERKTFSQQVIDLCHRSIAEGIEYKQLTFSLSEDVIKIAEKKLKKLEKPGIKE